MSAPRYAVVLDGDLGGAEHCASRARAERYAAWLRHHPACRDRVQHGHGGVVRIVPAETLVVCEWTGELHIDLAGIALAKAVQP